MIIKFVNNFNYESILMLIVEYDKRVSNLIYQIVIEFEWDNFLYDISVDINLFYEVGLLGSVSGGFGSLVDMNFLYQFVILYCSQCDFNLLYEGLFDVSLLNEVVVLVVEKKNSKVCY